MSLSRIYKINGEDPLRITKPYNKDFSSLEDADYYFTDKILSKLDSKYTVSIVKTKEYKTKSYIFTDDEDTMIYTYKIIEQL
jgi:hypothetical protein